ncbi:hypothetical protein CHS0354_026789 [Potamilus streckersoni]|uniref:GTP 3',8-cyclase n=1 Tax=Potamilus streckersoni TaxID=2493646 RepID=A0AAE0T5Q9_9BIVA|nr:hypothetical protein CHS0354_026789 [Potamilus streckersoni]
MTKHPPSGEAPANPSEYGDIYGRQFKALRISLTQSCNFSCVYCVPDGMTLKRLPNELSTEEFTEILTALHRQLRLEKIRITGGEPLLYKYFDRFVEILGGFGIPDLSLTSNGTRIAEKAELLYKNGFRRINLSMDSLKPDVFRSMSRGGDSRKTMHGLETCLSVGFKLKVNMVPMRTLNRDEIITMLDFCLSRGIELRYIELMRMGHVGNIFEQEYVSKDYILGEIGRVYNYRRLHADADSTAELYEIPGAGRFGIIANETSPFCKGCNRLRLTSDGRLYGCISAVKNFDAREILGLPEADADKVLRRLLAGAMQTKQTYGFIGSPYK